MSTTLAEPDPPKPQHEAWTCDGCPVHPPRYEADPEPRALARALGRTAGYNGEPFYQRRYYQREG